MGLNRSPLHFNPERVAEIALRASWFWPSSARFPGTWGIFCSAGDSKLTPDCLGLNTGGPSSQCEDFIFFNLYANVYRAKRDTITADIYYYKTTEFGYAKRDLRLAVCAGVVLQRFELIKVCMGKNGNRHYSWNFDIFAIKMTHLNALLSFLLSSRFSARSEAI